MNAAYVASIARLAMRTATAVSKCVLTSPGSSTVLATASCDARFALAQKPKPKAAPRSRPSNALCSLSTRSFGMNSRFKDLIRDCTGFAQLTCLPCFVHLAVDWSCESSRWYRSQIPTSVDALIYTNNLSQKELCWTAGLLQPLAAALLTDDRCGTATVAINQWRAPLTVTIESR